jgi:hypothetical protein
MPTSRAPSALAAPPEQGAATGIEVGLGECERLVHAQSGAPQDHDQAAQPTAGADGRRRRA